MADAGNQRIQKWAPGATSGSTVAGTGGGGIGATQLSNPSGVYLDGNGNIYVSDEDNHRVQKFAASIITTMTAATAGDYSALVTTAAGAAATNVVTVTATSAGSITGASTVALGANIALTDATAGGTWSASNGNATVAGGVVHGVNAGTVTISYSVSGSCGPAAATRLVTVGTSTTTATVASISAVSGFLCVGATDLCMDATVGGAWSVSPASVATVSPTGTVYGVSVGTASVTYTVGSSFATTVLTVFPVPAAIAGSAGVCSGGGTTVLSDPTPGGSWTSVTASIASVGGTTGVVTGTIPGTVTIYYTLVAPAGCRSSVIVTVNPTPSNISGPVSVCTGSSIALTDVTAGGSWSSASGNITVGGSGSVTGNSIGAATVTYAMATGCLKTYNITVNTLDAGTISGPSVVTAGSTISLTDAAIGGLWSAGNSNASVSAVGVVTGALSGTVTISYKVTNMCGTASALQTVTVNPVPGTAITGTLSVCLGSTTALSDGTSGGTWHSSNTLVASIGTSGVVTGAGAGTASISYNLSGVVTVVVVTVNPVPAGISGPASVCNGSSITLNDATAGGAWTATTGVAITTGTAAATVTGTVVGTSTITYSLASGCYKTLAVSVKALPTSILGNPVICGVGSVAFLSDATAGTSWTTNPVGTATVSGSGRVYGVAPGTATVTYTAANSCTTTTVVTVNTLVTLPAISGASSVGHGLTIALSDATPGGVWSSSNPALGSVDAVGDVTGLSTSSATITITYALSYAAGGCTAIAAKAISLHNPAPHDHGSLTTTMGVVLNMSDDIADGDWASSDNAVATVDANGTVTAIAAGLATITHTAVGSDGATSSHTTDVLVDRAAMNATILPNPNNGTFVVKGILATKEDVNVAVEIINTLGQSVYSGTATAAGGIVDESVKLGNTLANGMYLLKLSTTTEQKVLHFVIEK